MAANKNVAIVGGGIGGLTAALALLRAGLAVDVYQQARFRVFEEQIERRKLELIMRARQQNRPLAPRRPPQF